jgi:hypothetical protein
MKKTIFLVAMVTAIISSAFTVFAMEGLKFPDVDDNAYYADSVYKMQERGVVSGYENGNFGPNDSVTRGQVATMLDRYDQSLTGTIVATDSGKGVDDLIYIVCAGLTAEDMGNNPYLSGNVEYNKELYEKVCVIQ